MRYYIEELADTGWSRIKQYILSIKDFSSKELIEECLKNLREFNPEANYLKEDWWIKDYKEYHKNDSLLTLITRCVEEKFYIFQDKEEHEWNKHVVESTLNNKKWIHRWDNLEIE